MAKSKKPNELRLIREYDAPLKMVWDAWNDPKQAAKWWGPRGFTITHKSKDLRPGGQWIYTMHGPDGKDWPNIATYHEVEPYAKLVYDHGATPTTPPLFRVTVYFTEKNGKTTIDMSMAFESPERAKEMAGFIKAAGGNGTWDRFAEYLEKEKSGKEEFVINRSFHATPEKLYEMFTNREHLKRWLPPAGFKMEYISDDFYKMSNGEVTMFGKFQYLDKKPGSHLSYIQSFADEKGNMGRHPALSTFPNYLHVDVTFTDEGDGETRVTLVTTAHGEVNAEEMNAFINLRSGMTMGWTGSFDKLEEVLA